MDNTSKAMSRCSSTSVSDCEDILREILSRLPVKSLMRFKCVSKRWQFSITQDRGLIDLHFIRSKPRCSDLFIFVPRDDSYNVTAKEYTYKEFFLLANFFQTTSLIIRKSKEKWLHYSDILKPVNGLICFANRRIDSVRILNPSTGERTPWIASNERYNLLMSPTYFFGFDPATKQHKVICTRRVREPVTDIICEVLTVGDNTWRHIDDKVPFSNTVDVLSVYSNGFIYWVYRSHEFPKYLNAFNVGCEKFKVIKVPNEITEQCEYPRWGYFPPRHSLLEVGGHIALLQQWADKAAQLWICEDDTPNGSYSEWNEINLELPFQWRGLGRNSRYHGVAGEDRIIIESRSSSDIKNVSLYSYDWKKNTSKEATVGVVSEFTSVSLLSSFTESLWPVN